MAKDWFRLSYRSIVGLFIFYIGVFLIGIVGSLLSFLHESFLLQSQPVINKSVFSSVSMAFLGSSIFYVRKLYKACIGTDVAYPSSPEDMLRQLGIVFYFLFRPFFGVAFALLILVGIKASVLAVVAKNAELDSGLIYFTMFTSFFAGFSAGDLLDLLEDVGKEVLRKLFAKVSE